MDPIVVPNQPPTPAWRGWGSNVASPPVASSLQSVMDEEYARNLQLEEEAAALASVARDRSEAPAPATTTASAAASAETDVDVLTDEVIARQLQEEYDRDHDESLRARQRQMNGLSNVTVSLDLHQRSQYPQEYEAANEEEEDYDDEDEEDLPIQTGTRPTGSGGGGGRRQRQKRGGMSSTTKHDATVCGQRNARQMEDALPPGMAVGQLQTHDGKPMCLSKSSVNALVSHSKQQSRSKARLRESKDHSTYKSIDPRTAAILSNLGARYVSDLSGTISSGKEADIHHAFGERDEEEEEDEDEQGAHPTTTTTASAASDGEEEDDAVDVEEEDGESPPEPPNNRATDIRQEYAIKIFKTTLAEFKTRDRYIRDDMRFSDRYGSQNPRKIVHLWAEKEFRNLSRLRQAGLPCPEPIVLKDHVIVMSFIGRDGKAAPKLRDAKLSDKQKQRAYEQCITLMTRMFRDCKLIHADLSQYNLLWYNRQLYIIDVSQSVEPHHENAMEFLYRDISTLVTFFRKIGVRKVADPHQIMCDVTGYDVSPRLDKEVFIEKMTKHAELKRTDRHGGFDCHQGSPDMEMHFEEMYQRGLVENAMLHAEKQRKQLEEAGAAQDSDSEVDVDNI